VGRRQPGARCERGARPSLAGARRHAGGGRPQLGAERPNLVPAGGPVRVPARRAVRLATGKAVDAGAFRVAAPVFELVVPADNVFGAAAGTYAPATADGVYAELAPLDPGEHVVQWVVSPDRPRSNSTTQSTTYHLTVVP
jgi:hypothetical protein